MLLVPLCFLAYIKTYNIFIFAVFRVFIFTIFPNTLSEIIMPEYYITYYGNSKPSICLIDAYKTY